MQIQFKLLTLIFLTVIFCFGQVAAQNSDDLEQMIRASKTRAILVQNVRKAVVHIKVEKIVRNPDGKMLNNPMDLYNDEFFRRFFPELRKINSQKNVKILLHDGSSVYNLCCR